MLCSRTSLVAALAGSVLVSSGLVLYSKVLEVYDTSLTSYLTSAKTLVQDLRPRAEQRGVNLDGSMRSAPTHGLALAGNPFESAWRGHDSHNGVRLDTGTYGPTDVDLALPAPGTPWRIGRSYNDRQDAAGLFDSNGYAGRNWANTSQPELLLFAGATADLDVVYLVYGADRYVEFQRTGVSSADFKAKNGAAGAFSIAEGSPDIWTYIDPIGTESKFFGGNTASNQANWQLWKITDQAGNVAYVGHATNAALAIYNTDAPYTQATTGQVES
jgi:hypothetical protein